MPTLKPQPQELADRRQAVTDVIRFLHAKGWTPATSSNFSFRLPEPESHGFAISISGRDKGEFTPDDFIAVDFEGRVSDPKAGHIRPSAETPLHALIYEVLPDMDVVLHTHSVNATVLSLLDEPKGVVKLSGFEILKGLEGIRTHEAEVSVPVFSNAQDMVTLAGEIRRYFRQHGPGHGFLLAGHGLYTWGKTPQAAKRHVEVFEFLFESVLKLRSYGYPDPS